MKHYYLYFFLMGITVAAVDQFDFQLINGMKNLEGNLKQLSKELNQLKAVKQQPSEKPGSPKIKPSVVTQDQCQKFDAIYTKEIAGLKTNSDAWQIQEKLINIRNQWRQNVAPLPKPGDRPMNYPDFIKNCFTNYMQQEQSDEVRLDAFVQFILLLAQSIINLFDGDFNYKGSVTNRFILLNDAFAYDGVQATDNMFNQPNFIFSQEQFDLLNLVVDVKNELVNRKGLAGAFSQAFEGVKKREKDLSAFVAKNEQAINKAKQWIGLPSTLSKSSSPLELSYFTNLSQQLDQLIKQSKGQVNKDEEQVNKDEEQVNKDEFKAKLANYVKFLYKDFAKKTENQTSVTSSQGAAIDAPASYTNLFRYFEFYNQLQPGILQWDFTELTEKTARIKRKYEKIATLVKDAQAKLKNIALEYEKNYRALQKQTVVANDPTALRAVRLYVSFNTPTKDLFTFWEQLIGKSATTSPVQTAPEQEEQTEPEEEEDFDAQEYVTNFKIDDIKTAAQKDAALEKLAQAKDKYPGIGAPKLNFVAKVNELIKQVKDKPIQ